MLELILPPWVAAVEAFGEVPGATLFPEEAAVVAALGVDAEPNEALPDGVYDMVALASEQARMADLAAAGSVGGPSVCWDRLLFCAKEAVYKAWFPVARRWLDFHEADITIDAAAIDAQHGTFSARLLVPGPLVAGSPLTDVHGRWLAARGLLLTATVVSARPRASPGRGRASKYPRDVCRGDSLDMPSSTGPPGDEY